jgi:hypothetical protein
VPRPLMRNAPARRFTMPAASTERRIGVGCGR